MHSHMYMSNLKIYTYVQNMSNFYKWKYYFGVISGEWMLPFVVTPRNFMGWIFVCRLSKTTRRISELAYHGCTKNFGHMI
jgi:hypothetical protein